MGKGTFISKQNKYRNVVKKNATNSDAAKFDSAQNVY